MSKNRVQNLNKMAAVQEANYRKLLRLLTQSQPPKSEALPDTQFFLLNLQITEVFEYTFTVKVSLNLPVIGHSHLYVRCYQDAKMAEVVNNERGFCQQFASRYDYPNPNLYQPDEKWQLNLLLKEWLNYCKPNNLMKTKHKLRLKTSS